MSSSPYVPRASQLATLDGSSRYAKYYHGGAIYCEMSSLMHVLHIAVVLGGGAAYQVECVSVNMQTLPPLPTCKRYHLLNIES